MTRCTTRIAGLGAGALLALGFLSAAPAGAADGAQADATVGNSRVTVETADALNQTLGIVNQVCTDAGRAGTAAASALASEHGIAVAAEPAGGLVSLQVSLPALTDSLPSLGSLPLLGSLTGEVDAAQPLQVSCASSAEGSSLGLSAAGVDVLVDAIAPGIDVSALDLDIPAIDASVSATASGSAVPGSTAVSATAAGSLPATRASASPSARTSAAAPAATTSTSAAADTTSAAPATSESPSVAAGTLARTGAGVGALGLLGSALIGGGRLVAFGRKFLRIG